MKLLKNKYKKLYAYPILKSLIFKKGILLEYIESPETIIKPSNMYIKRIFIGTSGLTDKHTFESYSNKLNSIEINYTFYRIPTPKFITNLQKYNLKYTIKVNKLITHYKQLLDIEKIWADFYDLFTPLGNKIICFLFQFSKRFVYSENNLNKLKKLGKILNQKHSYAF